MGKRTQSIYISLQIQICTNEPCALKTIIQQPPIFSMCEEKFKRIIFRSKPICRATFIYSSKIFYFTGALSRSAAFLCRSFLARTIILLYTKSFCLLYVSLSLVWMDVNESKVTRESRDFFLKPNFTISYIVAAKETLRPLPSKSNNLQQSIRFTYSFLRFLTLNVSKEKRNFVFFFFTTIHDSHNYTDRKHPLTNGKKAFSCPGKIFLDSAN